MSTQVDPAVLRRSATAGDDLATDLTRKAEAVDAETGPAVRALPGFRLRGALERLQWGWRDALTRHESYLQRVGDALLLSAAGYREADAESARSFRALDET